jgi:Cu/Ag efflux protein CusF
MIQRVKINTARAVAMLCLLLGMTGCSLFSNDGVSGTISQGLVSSTAQVKAIDMETRTVTLQHDDGSTVEIHAGDRCVTWPKSGWATT